MNERRFDCPNEVMRNHLEKIGRTFLEGYHLALKNFSSTSFDFQNIESMYRGFAYEGVAMALMLIDIITFSKGRRIHTLISKEPKHIYMLHVGTGWALARIPFISIRRCVKRFNPALRGLVIDGYGFHQAYFKTKKYVYDMKIPKELENSNLIHAFYQGVGRALWFIYGGQSFKISSKINAFSKPYQPDLWAGVGLAVAYAGGVEKKELQELQELIHHYNAELAQGVAFACKTRFLANNMEVHTELAASIFCNLSAIQASQITDIEYAKVVNMNDENELYAIWRYNIIKKFKKQFSNESIYTKTYH